MPLDKAKAVAMDDTTVSRSSSESESEELQLTDPLGIKQLSLTFDYLMYKIKDRVDGIGEECQRYVEVQEQQVDEQLEAVQLAIDSLKRVIGQCDEIAAEFQMVEQIALIVRDFTDRLDKLDI